VNATSAKPILVVDDDSQMRAALSEAIQRLGYSAVMCDSGAGAISKLSQSVYSLIVTDMKMPKMDGLTFLKEVRHRVGNLPVLVITGFGTVENAVESMKEGATDLHFEPVETELRIRIGFEGVMKRLVSLPKDISENLTNVLKTKGGLNAFEKKKPQEGRFSLTVGPLQFDLRISTVPVLYGERISVRFLQKNARVANIEELGFSSVNLEKVRSLLRRPTGLFLVTGSSGSGKSTTVYAAVNDRMRILTGERLALITGADGQVVPVERLTGVAAERVRQIDAQLPRLLRQRRVRVDLVQSDFHVPIADLPPAGDVIGVIIARK